MLQLHVSYPTFDSVGLSSLGSVSMFYLSYLHQAVLVWQVPFWCHFLGTQLILCLFLSRPVCKIQ